jgi:hypothetical protein
MFTSEGPHIVMSRTDAQNGLDFHFKESCLCDVLDGRDYFAGLKVTKRNKATVLLTLTLLQTPTLTLTLT